MKTLFPKQKEALDFFYSCHQRQTNDSTRRRGTLDSSQMGTGKTVVGARLAMKWGDPVAVICPKSVITNWRNELAEVGIDPIFVLNPEQLRTGKTEWASKFGRGNKYSMQKYRWELPSNTLVLVDEIHMMKGRATQTAGLLVSLVRRGCHIHGMSGTPCENPVEMKALGYMLGLHSLNGPPMSYWAWLRKLKCKKNHWKQWEMTDPEYALGKLRKLMYGKTTMGLRVEDFPDSFKENRVSFDPVDFKLGDVIQEAYEDLFPEPESFIGDVDLSDKSVISAILGDPTEEWEGLIPLTKILKARQSAEQFKVYDVCQLAKDYVDQGHNVAVFLNFKESIIRFMDEAGEWCGGYIDGSVSQDRREQLIDDFQNDKTHCLVLNSATGGTGISLHDVRGDRSRVALISPSFNAKEFAQVLGRIHRNGAKSSVLQKVLICANSVETEVMKAVREKIKNMNLLHNTNIA